MFRFWFREVMGWLLVLLGLYLFLVCLGLLLDPRPKIIEAPIVSVLGIVVFRGGIHLLKVAVAARICIQTQPSVQPPPQPQKPTRETPWDW